VEACLSSRGAGADRSGHRGHARAVRYHGMISGSASVQLVTTLNVGRLSLQYDIAQGSAVIGGRTPARYRSDAGCAQAYRRSWADDERQVKHSPSNMREHPKYRKSRHRDVELDASRQAVWHRMYPRAAEPSYAEALKGCCSPTRLTRGRHGSRYHDGQSASDHERVGTRIRA
jgi:hypothetical protein